MNFERGDEGQTSSPGSLKKVLKLARAAVDLSRTIVELETSLSEATKRYNSLRHVDIPDAMSEAGLESFKLPSGEEVTTDDFVSGSLPKDPEKRDVAIALLEQYGGAGLIKTEVSLKFSKAEHDRAVKLATQLQKRGLPAEVASSVHAQSLMAFGRERLRNGENTDWEKLGLFAGRIAKFKVPGKKREKKDA